MEEEDTIELLPTTLEPHLQEKANVTVYQGIFDDENRILSSSAERREYVKDKEAHSALHWGQRKLWISEVEFLTKYGHLAKLIVYAGAAGGYHIPFLSSMFPHHVFHLYDPAEFGINESEMIKIFNEKMTDKIAKKYSKQDTLFISDIRNVESPETEKDVKKRKKLEKQYAMRIFEDNEMQRGWAKLMNPKASMVKFKLPYEDIDGNDFTVYPKGQIHLPVWGKQTTTETRLMFENANSEKKYKHKKYEEQMAYFNKETLLTYYPHEYGPESDFHPDGFDHCYSCRSELFILENYVRMLYNIPKEEEEAGTSPLLKSIVKNIADSVYPYFGPKSVKMSIKTGSKEKESGE